MESFKIRYSFDITYIFPQFLNISSPSTVDAKHIYECANQLLNSNMFVKSSSCFNGWGAYRSNRRVWKC